MKSAIFFLTISALISIKCFSQSSTINWDKTYGSINDENGDCIIQTKDGGYIITGYTKSIGAGESDAWLLRLNSVGDTLWSKVFGGPSWDWGQTLLETEDGGFLLTIRYHSFGAGNYDAWILKTDAEGDTIWTKFWGEEDNEWLTGTDHTWDGNYVFTGRTSSFGAKGEDIWLIKSDPSGNILWNKTIGGDLSDNAGDVKETEDKGFIIAGRTYSFGAGNSDIWLVKTDQNGDTVWTKAYGGSNSDYGVSVQQTGDGGYLLIGNTSSFGQGNSDIWALRTDANGDTLWTKLLGGIESERAFALNLMSNEYALIGGSTNSIGTGSLDGWLIIMDKNGEVYWSQTFGDEENDMILACIANTDEEIIAAGYRTIPGNNSDLWLMNILIDLPLSVPSQNLSEGFHLFQNYPNPFNPSTVIRYQITHSGIAVNLPAAQDNIFEVHVSVKIFDILGREITALVNSHQTPGSYEVIFDPSSIGLKLKSGIYFCRLKAVPIHSISDNYIKTMKMILLK